MADPSLLARTPSRTFVPIESLTNSPTSSTGSASVLEWNSNSDGDLFNLSPPPTFSAPERESPIDFIELIDIPDSPARSSNGTALMDDPFLSQWEITTTPATSLLDRSTPSSTTAIQMPEDSMTLTVVDDPTAEESVVPLSARVEMMSLHDTVKEWQATSACVVAPVHDNSVSPIRQSPSMTATQDTSMTSPSTAYPDPDHTLEAASTSVTTITASRGPLIPVTSSLFLPPSPHTRSHSPTAAATTAEADKHNDEEAISISEYFLRKAVSAEEVVLRSPALSIAIEAEVVAAAAPRPTSAASGLSYVSPRSQSPAQSLMVSCEGANGDDSASRINNDFSEQGVCHSDSIIQCSRATSPAWTARSGDGDGNAHSQASPAPPALDSLRSPPPPPATLLPVDPSTSWAYPSFPVDMPDAFRNCSRTGYDMLAQHLTRGPDSLADAYMNPPMRAGFQYGRASVQTSSSTASTVARSHSSNNEFESPRINLRSPSQASHRSLFSPSPPPRISSDLPSPQRSLFTPTPPPHINFGFSSCQRFPPPTEPERSLHCPSTPFIPSVSSLSPPPATVLYLSSPATRAANKGRTAFTWPSASTTTSPSLSPSSRPRPPLPTVPKVAAVVDATPKLSLRPDWGKNTSEVPKSYEEALPSNWGADDLWSTRPAPDMWSRPAPPAVFPPNNNYDNNNVNWNAAQQSGAAQDRVRGFGQPAYYSPHKVDIELYSYPGPADYDVPPPPSSTFSTSTERNVPQWSPPLPPQTAPWYGDITHRSLRFAPLPPTPNASRMCPAPAMYRMPPSCFQYPPPASAPVSAPPVPPVPHSSFSSYPMNGPFQYPPPAQAPICAPPAPPSNFSSYPMTGWYGASGPWGAPAPAAPASAAPLSSAPAAFRQHHTSQPQCPISTQRPITCATAPMGSSCPASAYPALNNHPVFWFADGTVVFSVENTLFKVHRYFFERHSEPLRKILASNPAGDTGTNSVDSQHFTLIGVKASDFEKLLYIFYPTHLASIDLETVDDWTTILSLGIEYEMPQIKVLAMAKLNPLLSGVERIALANKLLADDPVARYTWLSSVYMELCGRGYPLSVEEAEKLDKKTIVKVWQVQHCVNGLGAMNGSHQLKLRELVWENFASGR